MRPSKLPARPCVFLLLLFGVLGCDNSEEDAAPVDYDMTPTLDQLAEFEANTTFASSFGTPKANGTFSTSLRTIFKGGFQDDEGNGYAFEIGREGTAFSAVGGVLSGTDLGAVPPSGLATMHGTYEVHEAGKSDGAIRDYGTVQSTRGRISLRADFTFNTLQGSDGTLTVDGTFSGSELAGSAFFNKRPAALAGEVGSGSAVGVFHGSDDATAYVGGFFVER